MRFCLQHALAGLSQNTIPMTANASAILAARRRRVEIQQECCTMLVIECLRLRVRAKESTSADGESVWMRRP
jgi:hypothetical protein